MQENNVFLGRQPIFDRHGEVEAYELLFRSGASSGSSAGMFDGEQATATVLVNALMHFGLQRVSGGKPLFVNGTYDFLTGEHPSLLPPAQVVLEVLEDVEPDARVVDSCRKWKEMGFRIALDDFLYAPQLEPLVEIADLIKVDISLLPEGGLKEEVGKLKGYRGRLLAEKVETPAQHQEALEAGFHLFQGYFYCKPETMGSRAVSATQTQALQAMQQIMTAESVKDIEDVLSRDLSLSYELLKYINSVGFGLRVKVNSISHALNLLGMRNVRTWLSIVVLSKSMAGTKMPELMKQALLRGRFLELLAETGQDAGRKSDYFILGMFSLLDALLDMPMERIVEELFLPDFVSTGLIDKGSMSGGLLGLVAAVEQGEWEELPEWYGVSEERDYASLFMDAVSWADALLDQ
ncbi:MAG TPA: HDOD domain-containing protein [Mariprofundaceae bacterium]|nr:HDOD domain-containing protein [Mariprofundaceae bacterium]